MFFYTDSKLAVIAMPRCGHTNMHHYFGMEPYSDHHEDNWKSRIESWKNHHNPIIVLRNPLDRVVSSMVHVVNHTGGDPHAFFVEHSYLFLNTLMGVNFRIIDFYDLEKYIPRRSDLIQSFTTFTTVDVNTKPEDVYLENSVYTLHQLRQEVKLYKQVMNTHKRVSVEEWKELTREINAN
jgi:hypothetical protein